MGKVRENLYKVLSKFTLGLTKFLIKFVNFGTNFEKTGIIKIKTDQITDNFVSTIF